MRGRSWCQIPWRRSVYSISLNTCLLFSYYSTTLTRTTLKLPGMNSNAQNTRRSGRQTKKSFKVRENDALAPILLEALPIESQQLVDKGIPQFEPQERLPFLPMTVRVPIITPLQLFLLLLGEETLLAIVSATNANAAVVMALETDYINVRPWHPLTRNELIVWLGTLFFMGRHHEFNREYHWDTGILNIGRLGKFISKTRWEQIHRFFKINPKGMKRQPDQPWWYKVDPLLTTVRQNIKNAVSPASWLAVDELMIPFQGRTKHSIKIKGKPIKEGFQIWCLGFKGYIWTFSFHSKHENDEGMPPSRLAPQPDPLPSIHLAPTQQVPLYLCEQVRQFYNQHFLVFLDSLFLNIAVAHCLYAIEFSVMGTTRKNAAGVPVSLTDVLAKDKKAKKDAREEDKPKKLQLAYNSVLAVIVHKCLCFLWQDNATVLAITTAHSLHRTADQVTRKRKRPSGTSANAKKAFACFEGQVVKELEIPVPIDDYNHGMNGVDTASQIQRGFSIHQPSEVKWYRPIFYWIVDICQNNAYLIWRTTQKHPLDKHDHRRWIDILIEQMLGYDKFTPAPMAPSEHYPEYLDTRGRCVWGKRTAGGCVQGTKRKRTVLSEISGNARPEKRPRQVRTGCKQCGVHLCIDRDCWHRHHASNTSK